MHRAGQCYGLHPRDGWGDGVHRHAFSCYSRTCADVMLQKEFAMARSKQPDNGPRPRPGGSWLAGLMIGSAIFTLATSAMVLGAGLAVRDSSLKG